MFSRTGVLYVCRQDTRTACFFIFSTLHIYIYIHKRANFQNQTIHTSIIKNYLQLKNATNWFNERIIHTFPWLSSDGFAGFTWLTWSSCIHCTNPEFICHTFFQVICSTLAVRSFSFTSFCPAWGSFFTLFNNISCDWRSTIFYWWSPSQVYMVFIPISSFRSARSIRFI